MTVYRTGRTAGTTSGTVVNTCVDTGLILHNGAFNIEVFCAEEAAALADGGDSGGPVYTWVEPLAVDERLALGIAFASGTTGSGDSRYWFSTWSQIVSDMGRFLYTL